MKATAFDIGKNKTTQTRSMVNVNITWTLVLRLLKCLLKIGNNENHSTAKDSKPKTSVFVSNLEASNTEANIAALVDIDPGILLKI